jgi:spoIIIJ-associated protein
VSETGEDRPDGPDGEPTVTEETSVSVEADVAQEDVETTGVEEDSESSESAGSSGVSEASGTPEVPTTARVEREGDVAADYLEGLLDIADLDGDIDMDVEGDRALVSIVGADLTDLVGRDGEVLDALQELTRLAVLRETGERSRLMLDIAGHRARLREELSEHGRAAAERARATGAPVRLEPMTPFERKVVHDAVAAAGQRSESEGVEPGRYVVVLP